MILYVNNFLYLNKKQGANNSIIDVEGFSTVDIQFNCNGNENSLRKCSIINNYNCASPGKAAGLICGGKQL